MYLKYLNYFIAVAECKNFSRAAEKLNTVQPSISRQIKKLEEIVGTQLFIRSPHEIELTHAGDVFLDQARLILRQFDQAKALALDAAMLENNTLNVGIILGTEQPFFDHILIPTKRKHPDMTINLTTKNELELIESVKSGILDSAFLMGPIEDDKLVSHFVCNEKIAVAVSVNDPIANKELISIDDLAYHTLYLPSDTNSPFYKSALRNILSSFKQSQLNSSVLCDSAMAAMQSICINDEGCCFVSKFQRKYAPDNVVIIDLAEDDKYDFTYNLVLIASKENGISSINRAIENIIN